MEMIRAAASILARSSSSLIMGALALLAAQACRGLRRVVPPDEPGLLFYLVRATTASPPRRPVKP